MIRCRRRRRMHAADRRGLYINLRILAYIARYTLFLSLQFLFVFTKIFFIFWCYEPRVCILSVKEDSHLWISLLLEIILGGSTLPTA
jgi:hypothetical protein